MDRIKVQLLDRQTDVQYGLNWGQREGREPNQAYLQLESVVYKSNYFPEKGKYFVVRTDDEKTLVLNRAQKEYGCALQTPESNSVLGLYIRKRLGVDDDCEIRKDAILNYGRLDIEFYKIDDMNYIMDFSRDWKSTDVKYVFSSYLLTQRICSLWKEVDSLNNSLERFSKEMKVVNLLTQTDYKTVQHTIESVGDVISNLGYQNVVNIYAQFLQSKYFSEHYGNKDVAKLLNSPQIKRVNMNNQPLQQIFYGAPGTGKSHTIKCATKGYQTFRTTFHPDSDYASFVGAYKPTCVESTVYTNLGNRIIACMDANGQEVKEKRIEYSFVKQCFLQAYVAAWRSVMSIAESPVFLIIEEINRGNCAQIFGDIFQLLDRDERGFSEYPIHTDRDLEQALADSFASLDVEQIASVLGDATLAESIVEGREMLLPGNLYIWATMNTSDQSLFPIDSAFKRRWDWQYIPISDANLEWTIEAGGQRYSWWHFLEKINSHIYATTQSEDKQLGYFFCRANDGIIDAKSFVGKVIFYLWNDVFKDYTDTTLFRTEDGEILSFDKFYHTETDRSIAVVDSNITIFLHNVGVEPLADTVKSTEKAE